MIDIVIPLGVDTRWQDNELRYTLRSIQKYLRGYRDIYIIGNKRRWLKERLIKTEHIIYDETSSENDGVIFIPATEDYVRKQKSIFDKLLIAANTEAISDPFCMFNDDHFLLQPLNIADIKYWKWGTLQNLLVKSLGTYQRIVQNTMKYHKTKGWPETNFDIHVPILYEKEKIKALADEDWSKDHIIKSSYCNMHGIKGEDMKDLVIGKPLRRDEVRKAIAGRMWWSINEQGTNDAVKDILQELYPDKSKFEV